MVDVKNFVKHLQYKGIEYFSGVPDSVLTPFIDYLVKLDKTIKHRIATNEGSAVALASGNHLAKKKIPLVYLQNSGLGNALSPLTSLVDEKVYSIPMIILVGHRGAPNIPDEPQHNKLGPELLKILKAHRYKYFKLNKDNYKNFISKAIFEAKKKLCPVFLIVDKNFFKIEKTNKKEKKLKTKFLKRYDYLNVLLKNKNHSKSLFVASTGFTGRELYSIGKNLKKENQCFYNIGAMGHANQIGLEISLNSKKKVVILDGDGAIQMHMGNLALLGKYKSRNILHVLFNNKVHESTGGQPVANQHLNYSLIFKGCGYDIVKTINNLNQFIKEISKSQKKLTALIINIEPGTIKSLPRPKENAKYLKRIFKVI